VAAWLAVGKETAVVSHESALALLDLSDVIPKAVHLTVPRSRRHLPTIPGVKVHTTTRPLGAGDVVERDGVRVTSAARTILDAAGAGDGAGGDEQPLDQGRLATPRRTDEDDVAHPRRSARCRCRA